MSVGRGLSLLNPPLGLGALGIISGEGHDVCHKCF